MAHDIKPDRLTELEQNFLEERANAILSKIKALPNFQRLTADFGLDAEEILGKGATLNHIRQYWHNAIEHGPKGPNGKIDWEAILNNLNEIFGHIHRVLSEKKRIKTLPLDTIPLCFDNEIREAAERAEREIGRVSEIFEPREEDLLGKYTSIIHALPNLVEVGNLREAQGLLTSLLKTPAIRKELDARVSVYRGIEADALLGEEILEGVSLAETAASLREKFQTVLP